LFVNVDNSKNLSCSLNEKWLSLTKEQLKELNIKIRGKDDELEELDLKLMRSKLFMNMIIHDIKHPAVSL
jgi:phosphoribosylformylglycinamidine (FGAM) synthase PurS component